MSMSGVPFLKYINADEIPQMSQHERVGQTILSLEHMSAVLCMQRLENKYCTYILFVSVARLQLLYPADQFYH